MRRMKRNLTSQRNGFRVQGDSDYAVKLKSPASIVNGLLLLLSFCATSNAAAAAVDCPCLNSSQVASILEPHADCTTDVGPGVWSRGACYPITFGSDECAAHDKRYDPRCSMVDKPPEYCEEEWCYIDNKACKLSTERYYIGSIVGETRLADQRIYYSYSTCNSTASHWLNYTSTWALEGVQLLVAVPGVRHSFHYKERENGEIADFRGKEYYDDNVPWKGWMLDYFNSIAGISNLGTVSYTYQSKGSDEIDPEESAWTSTVRDIQAGISCLAVSNFWITTERLRLAMFTAPVSTEKIYLYIKSPLLKSKEEETLTEHFQKTLAPFETNMWWVILGLFGLVAILSVVLATRESEASFYWERIRSSKFNEASPKCRAIMFLKIAFESFLTTLTSAMTGAEKIGHKDSLAQKFITFGFAFFVLITCSAYTANLAAFLTVRLTNKVNYIKDMEDAVARGAKVCIQSLALMEDLLRSWPATNVVSINHTEAISEDLFERGECDALLFSESQVLIDANIMVHFCSLGLVKTGPAVLEIPVGFPVCSDLAAGISHFIYKGQNEGISYDSYEEESRPQQVCSFDFPDLLGGGDTARITVQDFALPIVVLFICVVLALLSHFYGLYWKRKRRESRMEMKITSSVMEEDFIDEDKEECAPYKIPVKDSTVSGSALDTNSRLEFINGTTEIERMLKETKLMLNVQLEMIAAAAGKKSCFQKDVYV